MVHLITGFLIVFAITMTRYFLIAGTAFVVFYKWLSPKLQAAKIQARHAKPREFLNEIFHSSISSVMLALTAFVTIEGPLRPFTVIYDDIYARPLWWIPVSFVLALVIHDAYFYWMHRVMHHPRLFRITHLVHHQSTNPSPWTSYSFQAAEACLEGAAVLVICAFVPMHPAVIATFAFASFVVNVYGHLGYEIMPKKFRHSILFELINTSCYHNLHHRKFKGNYSLYFRHWDRLMHTEHPDYVKEYDIIQAKRFGSAPVARKATFAYSRSEIDA